MKNIQKIIVIALISLFTNVLHSQNLFKYTCIADRLDIYGIEASHTFDNDGIILSKNKYHPLTIRYMK